MNQVTTIKLTRDCEAIQIPIGNAITLKQGTDVDITQTLGGTFTVHSMGALFRIAGKDADALGVEIPEASSQKTDGDGPVEEAQIWDVLRTCYDPEIPVNIVDLGLIYDLHLEPGKDGAKISVKMTLTAPGCGMGGAIAGDAQQKILALPGVNEASVEVVWDPPWHQSMITPNGRRILGIE